MTGHLNRADASNRPQSWSLCFFALCYVLAGGLGQGLSLIPGVSIIFWPPVGILVATLASTPTRTWPWWLTAGCAAELICNAQWFHNGWALAILYFSANALESLAAAWIIRSRTTRPLKLDSFEDVICLLFAACVAPVVSATIIATIDNMIGKHSFWTAWPLVWLGDGSGLLVSAPLTLVAIAAWRERQFISLRSYLEAAILGAFIVGTGVLALTGRLPTVYLTLPALLWAAVRFQLRGAALGLAIITLLTAAYTAKGEGEFVGSPAIQRERIVNLQTFLAVSAVSSLLVAALSMQRQGALLKLEQANASLEARVAERTATLYESESRFRHMADHAPVMVWVSEVDGSCSYLSKSWLDFTGQNFEAALDYKRLDAVHPQDRPSVVQAFRKAHAQQEPFRLEYRLCRADGTYRWAIDAAIPRHNANGVFLGCVGSVIDITERKEAEEAVRLSEERFRRVYENAATGIAVLSAKDVRIVQCNPAYQQLLGYTESELQTAPFESLVHYEDRKEFGAMIRQLLAKQIPAIEIENRYIHRDRRVVWVHQFITVLNDSQGTPASFVVLSTDVSQRRQAEQDLRASEQRLRLATETAEMGIWEWNVHTNVIRWDAQMFRIYDLPPTPNYMVNYHTWRTAVLPEDLPDQERRLRETIRCAGRGTRAFRIRTPGGEIRHIEAVEAVRLDNNGEVETVVGTNINVTTRRKVEERLREADRQKDEFLATLAHELRNPLAPIRNGLQILKLAKGNVDAMEESRSIMDRQVEHLARLIDDLMDLSRITRGKILYRKTRMQLADAIKNAVDTSRSLIQERGHKLILNLPSEPLYVNGDIVRLSQVFVNLLNNAAKYTEKQGLIQLTMKREEGQIVITVEDNGVGIPNHMLPRVFEMFAQVDPSLEKSQGGLGIGLNIAKRLVEQHEGSITVESGGEGAGSRFIVQLPELTTPPERPLPQSIPSAIKNSDRKRILVVDDNIDGANSLVTLLRMMGNETQTASDGEEAVARAEAFQPDVILMDIGMPKQNGYEACRRIREKSSGKSITIVACTGWGQDEDKRKSAEAGFDFHLTKPIDFAALKLLLADLQPAST